jgi:hypothetical protein
MLTLRPVRKTPRWVTAPFDVGQADFGGPIKWVPAVEPPACHSADGPPASQSAFGGIADNMDRQKISERAIARKLKNAKANPPTFFSQLFRWSSLPGLLFGGLVGTWILAMLAQQPGSALSWSWAIAYGAFFLGAIFRDIGSARRTTRVWAAQTRFIDWDKVDEASAE